MNNKIITTFSTPFSYDNAGQIAFNSSALDELAMFCESIDTLEQSAGVISAVAVDTTYVPEDLTSGAQVDFYESILRQDVKRRVAERLPRATLGQGLVILSQSDAHKKYFVNSFVVNTASGFLRVGICNFTADYATNPFADGQNSTLSAVWGFFDITSNL